MMNHAVELSASMLQNVKLKQSLDEPLKELTKLHISTLQSFNDSFKIVFWVNIYNAFYQILANDISVNDKNIFTVRHIKIDSHRFSLDDIEHGILRKYRWKYSLGFFRSLFVAPHIKKLAVQKADFRIHFALNCVAKSCPPIDIYKSDDLDQRLNHAMTRFVLNESNIDPDKRILFVNRIMFWFYADFGGKKGILSIHEKILHQNLKGYSLRFNHYDWTPTLMNFSN
ncbi:MAG: DUF547 domain-containing protein [Cyclobacteriaceae bacterium]|nr:DUF547 domain-containing protein [Cyclobacteriaceae bacterium]